MQKIANQLLSALSGVSHDALRGPWVGLVHSAPSVSKIPGEMSENELLTILKSIDAAIDVYRNQNFTLSAGDLRVKSMLTVLRAQVADQLSRERASTNDGQ
jgi:hypothetical protein